jgi:hypothetical protein
MVDQNKKPQQTYISQEYKMSPGYVWELINESRQPALLRFSFAQ